MSNNSTAFDFLSDMDMQVRRQTDRYKMWSKATPSSPGGMPFSSLKPPLRGSGPAPPVHPSRAAATAAAAFSSAFLFLFSSCHSKVRLQHFSIAPVQAHIGCCFEFCLVRSQQAGPSRTSLEHGGVHCILSSALDVGMGLSICCTAWQTAYSGKDEQASGQTWPPFSKQKVCALCQLFL